MRLLALVFVTLWFTLLCPAQAQKHWAFVAAKKSKLPTDPSNWSSNAIDRFVLARMKQHGLKPSPTANRTTLIRRVTLDLTGLPPTPREVANFLMDSSPQAYEKVVGRLLASPRYGERMTLEWLDAARYADTHGYLFDTSRSMWRWRDWVIRSFNRNQSFDQFTIEQLAGDLLPKATIDQRIATGFNRNHIINNEAGASPQEYFVENVLDRVSTTGTVWLGLTLGCCQCHDHKYDPISQREFYQFYAFFNNLPELGLDGLNTNARPLIKAPTTANRTELRHLNDQQTRVTKQLLKLESKIASAQVTWEKGFRKKEQPPRKGLVGHWSLDKSVADHIRPKTPTTFQAGTAKYSSGVIGQSIALKGLGYVDAGNRFNFTAQSAFSFSAWLRLDKKAGRFTVYSRMERAGKLFRGHTLQIFAGFPSLFLINRFPDNMIQVQGKKALQANRWYHLTATYDGSGKAKGAKLYLDGKLQKKGISINKLSGPITTDQSFFIGNGHPGAKWKGRIDEARVYNRALNVKEIASMPGLSIQSLLAIPLKSRSAEQKNRVRKFYLKNHAKKAWRALFQKQQTLAGQQRTKQLQVPTVMVMQEQKKPRQTRILIRGAFNRPGEVVTAATPKVLPGFDKRQPSDRLGLARWLVNGRNPLTARVTVNRFWQMIFATGLVKTSDDFGVRGSRPTHPELLDWLACEFVDSGWDVKSLLRMLVTSSTYRQSSRITGDRRKLDPQNRWISRGPRIRLPAEFIRDSALFASGLMVERLGGASVRPYQPPGLWREVAFDISGGALTAQLYKQDKGSKLYRRSMYTFWKRTSPPPSMLLFDAPDRERCVVRRERTTTPLQALVLMNGPTYVEASRALAERMMISGGVSTDKRIAHGFQWLTSRQPTKAETRLLVQLYESQRRRFAANPKLAKKLLSQGASKVAKDLKRNELAALAIVANVIMNLDEVITRN